MADEVREGLSRRPLRERPCKYFYDERGSALASPRLAREAPDVLAAVRGLDGAIDVATMRALNRRVDEQGQSPAAVARSFLAREPRVRFGR